MLSLCHSVVGDQETAAMSGIIIVICCVDRVFLLIFMAVYKTLINIARWHCHYPSIFKEVSARVPWARAGKYPDCLLLQLEYLFTLGTASPDEDPICSHTVETRIVQILNNFPVKKFHHSAQQKERARQLGSNPLQMWTP